MTEGFRRSGSARWSKALSVGRGPLSAAICMICVMVAVATALGQSSQPAGDQPLTVEGVQKLISGIMARDAEEHARQVAEYNREVAEQRQSEADAKQPFQSLWIFLLVVAGFWIFLVVASIRRQRIALQRSQRMVELLESIDRRLPGPPAPPPSSPS